MFGISIRAGRAVTAALLVVLAVALAAAALASPARAALNPAGPGYVGAFRCCFRYAVLVGGDLSVDYGDTPNAQQQGQWNGVWQWTQVGVATFQEYSSGGGALVPLAAAEKEASSEIDGVQDREFEQLTPAPPGGVATYGYVYVPDKTNESRYGNGKDCETNAHVPYHDIRPREAQYLYPGNAAGNRLLSGDPGYYRPALDPFVCYPFKVIAQVPGPFQSDPAFQTGYHIPAPAYASFASGDANHALNCDATQFKVLQGGGAPTFKGARVAAVNVQFFPESQVGRYAKALTTERGINSPRFNWWKFPPTDLVLSAGNQPTAPFVDPPKNGCHKGG
jgi:hypothetical protein